MGPNEIQEEPAQILKLPGESYAVEDLWASYPERHGLIPMHNDQGLSPIKFNEIYFSANMPWITLLVMQKSITIHKPRKSVNFPRNHYSAFLGT